jgi:predicted kinase
MPFICRNACGECSPRPSGRSWLWPVLIDPARRKLVLVSGPPAAGKTTIAGPLAAELGFALLAKDRIKETLHASLAGDGGAAAPAGLSEGSDLAWSRRLGAASMELLWALAADVPAVVLEANFYTDDPRSRGWLAELAANPVEVFCQCPEEEYLRRYAARVPARHAAHVDSAPSRLAEGFTRSSRPFGLGPVITVDTTRPVDVPALARQVRRLLSGAGTA